MTLGRRFPLEGFLTVWISEPVTSVDTGIFYPNLPVQTWATLRARRKVYMNLPGRLHPPLPETTSLTRSPGRILARYPNKFRWNFRNHMNISSARGVANFKVAYSVTPFNQQGSVRVCSSRAFPANSSTPVWSVFTVHGGCPLSGGEVGLTMTLLSTTIHQHD